MKFFERLGNFISQKAIIFVVLSTIITIVMVFGIFKIEIKTSTDMMVLDNNAVMQDTKQFENEFGGETLILLLSGDKNTILQADNWAKMEEMQGEIAKLDQVRSVTSPVTIANMAADQAVKQQELIQLQTQQAVTTAVEQVVQAEIAKGASPAEQQAAAELAKEAVLQQVNVQYGEQLKKLNDVGEISATNPQFINFALFDENGSPISIADQVFLQAGKNALFSVQLDSGLSFQELSDVTNDIQAIIDQYSFSGLEKTYSGTPAITAALQQSIYDNLRVMIIAVIILMTLILLIVFPFRWRLLSLPVVLMGAV